VIVKDKAGENDVIQLRFRINNVNDQPISNISAPTDSSHFNTSWPVTFNGSGSYDPDEIYGDSINYNWLSDIEGLIGTGMELTIYMKTEGEHMITLKVTDREGLIDATAVTIYVNKTQGFMEDDIDHDDIPNDWEIFYGLDPYNSWDRDEDPDGDSLSNYDEYIQGTNPYDKDTDDDNHEDGEEVFSETDPNDPEDYPGKKKLSGDESLLFLFVAIFIVIAIAITYFFFLRYKNFMRHLDMARIEMEEKERLKRRRGEAMKRKPKKGSDELEEVKVLSEEELKEIEEEQEEDNSSKIS
jgi:hypothetical protein